MTMMSNLPRDLVEEILSRVLLKSLKSMRAVRLTCKNWNTLLKSRSLTRMYLGKIAAEARELGESRMIVMMNHKVYLRSVVINENPSTKLLGKLTCLNQQVKISQVFHCEGLILCMLKNNTRLVVWNPYLGQTRWIKTRYSYAQDKYKYAIGYENKKKTTTNKSWRSYKILRFRDVNLDGCYTGDHFIWYEIYDFDSNLWTSHDFTASWNIAFCDLGVSLKGNTYWCATNSKGIINYTVCFDFTRKSFGGLQHLPFQALYKQVVTLSCVRDEKLSVLVQSMETSLIEIWITNNKIEEQKLSWSKFLRVDMGPLPGLRVSDGRFFIEEEKKVAMVFNKDREGRLDTVKIFGEAGYFRELYLGEPSHKRCWPIVCSYVPV